MKNVSGGVRTKLRWVGVVTMLRNEISSSRCEVVSIIRILVAVFDSSVN